jgi:diguanylate cyclase (GGDEF)-like protein
MNQGLILSFVIPIILICFLFCEFHFFNLYETDLAHIFARYLALLVFFVAVGFMILEYTFESFQMFCFQYTTAVTVYFLDHHERGFFVFLLLPLTMLLVLQNLHLLSVGIFATILFMTLLAALFCFLIDSLKDISLFAKYTAALIVVNLATPLGYQKQQWQWFLQDNLLDNSVAILLGTILIVFVVYFYATALERKQAELKRLKFENQHDRLTSLLNYRAFSNYISEVELKGLPQQVIIMLDIDNFKKINDTYGHLEGNKILAFFAEKLSTFFKKEYQQDVSLFRFGGEEFCIILNKRSLDEGYISINKFEQQLLEDSYQYWTLDRQRVTLSFSGGIAVATLEETNIHDVIRDADAALYLAKENGRSQIVCPNCSV